MILKCPLQSMARWCAEHRPQYREIVGQGQLMFRRNRLFEGDEAEAVGYQRARVFLGSIHNARLIGGNGFVLTPEDTVVAHGLSYSDHDLVRQLEPHVLTVTQQFCELQLAETRQVRLLGEYVFVGGSVNFAHHLFESLMRLAVIDACEEVAGLPILVYDDLPANHYDYLATAGFAPERQVKIPRDAVVSVERLWMPSCSFHHDRLQNACIWPAGLHAMRRILLGRRQTTARPRLYISRANATSGRLVNEHEILPLLAQHGFQVWDPAAASVAEQLDLIRNAEMVFSALADGSAITALAPENCIVVEIAPTAAPAGLYNAATAADVLGQIHERIVGERVVLPDNPRSHYSHHDFRCDPQQVARALDRAEELIGNRGATVLSSLPRMSQPQLVAGLGAIGSWQQFAEAISVMDASWTIEPPSPQDAAAATTALVETLLRLIHATTQPLFSPPLMLQAARVLDRAGVRVTHGRWNALHGILHQLMRVAGEPDGAFLALSELAVVAMEQGVRSATRSWIVHLMSFDRELSGAELALVTKLLRQVDWLSGHGVSALRSALADLPRRDDRLVWAVLQGLPEDTAELLSA